MTEVESLIDFKKFQEDVKINPNDLQNGVLEHAGYFAYYGSLAARAARQMSTWKGRVELIEAKLGQKIRAGAEKKLNEAEITMRIKLEPAYQGAIAKYHQACEIHALCKIAQDAFWQRKEMLSTAARLEAEERRGQLRVFEDRGAQAEDRINRVLEKTYSPVSDNSI